MNTRPKRQRIAPPVNEFTPKANEIIEKAYNCKVDGITQWVCPEDKCKYSCYYKRYLYEHVCGIHTKELPYECRTCKKRFSKLFMLKGHVYHIHTSRRFKCPFLGCVATFATRTEIISHQGIHTSSYKGKSESGYECSSCKVQPFRTIEGLMTHIRLAHIIPLLHENSTNKNSEKKDGKEKDNNIVITFGGSFVGTTE